MPRYRVKRAGSLIGTWRKAGAIVTLTPDEARYFLPPHDDRLEEVKPVEAAASAAPAAPAATKSARPAADKG